MKYVGLLRGVNVGSGARVPMKDLKALLEGLGLVDVVTYLNSGNAVFSSTMGTLELTRLVEDALARAFGQEIPTLIKTSEEIDLDSGIDTQRMGSGPVNRPTSHTCLETWTNRTSCRSCR